MNEYVLLRCVKEGSKLRVKMTSSAPFVKGANCQFPRDVRQEGKYYVVRANDIKFKDKFYTAMRAGSIVCQTFDEAEVRRYIGEHQGDAPEKIKLAVFGDAEEDCVVCMAVAKDSVFAPCGHYACCAGCAARLAKCPMCRGPVNQILNRAQIE